MNLLHETKTTIMIVDDLPDNLDLLQNSLQGQGYNIVAFPRGAMALKAALKNPPDLILLDINMPEMDGFEVCRRLKMENTLKDIPVLFISALEASQDKIRAFSEGGVDYVTKPFHIEEVNARIRTHLSIVRMQKDLERHNMGLEALIKEKMRYIEEAHISTILAMVKLTEFRDSDTGFHIDRTRIICKILAEKLREQPAYKGFISDQFINDIYNAAPLHDIGKVGIPDYILLKPGKLTEDEWVIMKRHTTIGADTLREVQKKYVMNNYINMGIAIAQSHHEKWNGNGYPHGLSGLGIPLSARIMAVTDVYDALRSQRPYKPTFSHETSLEIILKGAGTDFDPDIVDAFQKSGERIRALFH